MALTFAGGENFQPAIAIFGGKERWISIARETLARRTFRRSFGSLSERQLMDAGLIPHDLDRACARPLTESVAGALRAAARRRAGNW